MIVGTDERRNAWMDEGLNTFIDIYESDAFQGGVYGPKRDAEFAPGAGRAGRPDRRPDRRSRPRRRS